MRVDLRVKHDIEARKAAIGLFERGHGYKSAAKVLSVPRGTVRQWLCVYRSFGSEVPLSMDGKRAGLTYWIDRTDVDSSGRGAGDGRAVYEGPRHPRHFTDEFKRQIVDLYNAGKPKREIMGELESMRLGAAARTVDGFA